MAFSGAVSLGDVVRCAALLRPETPETGAAIARMLGFEWRGLVPSALPSRPPGRGPVGAAATSPARPAPTPAADLSELPLLERTADRAEPPPLPWAEAEPLPPVEDRHLYGRLPHTPLLDPRWTRELLYAAIAREARDGPLDEEAAVNALAEGRVLERLPRLPRRALPRGVQLLVDAGVAMEPFRRDCLQFAHALRRVAGETTVQQLYFESTPDAGVTDRLRRARRPYAAPAPGAAVLVLSDLGLSPAPHPSPGADEWAALGRRLARRGSRLVAFVPYSPPHWPATLRRAVLLVHWDRRSTVVAVHGRRSGS